MKNRFKAWIDERVFWISYRSWQRHLERNPAYAYLIELKLREYREENPISKELAESTERFVEAMKDCKPNP